MRNDEMLRGGGCGSLWWAGLGRARSPIYFSLHSSGWLASDLPTYSS